MANVASYREIAERALAQAAVELNAIPTGHIRTDVLAAHAAKAQAIATIAVAQALLQIGDVLRDGINNQETP